MSIGPANAVGDNVNSGSTEFGECEPCNLTGPASDGSFGEQNEGNVNSAFANEVEQEGEEQEGVDQRAQESRSEATEGDPGQHQDPAKSTLVEQDLGHDAHDSSHNHQAADHHHDDQHGGTLMDHYLGQDHLIGHVQDQSYFAIPGGLKESDIIKVKIPKLSPFTDEKPLVAAPKGLEQYLGPITFQPTKFIIVELFAAIVVAALFIALARRIKSGNPPQGKLWNALEAGVVFVRDEIAKPSIGSHDAKRFLPLLLTSFFFILTMNFMGMFPLLGTPTGNISITISLALVVFAVVLFSGMKKLGIVGFWTAQAPHLDLPWLMRAPITLGIWAIEVFGLFVKHMVLAVRLFANMFAGHLVLAVFVGFIGVTWGQWLATGVIPAAIGASLFIGLLEVLVALIQAYVFTFLAALFIGSALHPH